MTGILFAETGPLTTLINNQTTTKEMKNEKQK